MKNLFAIIAIAILGSAQSSALASNEKNTTARVTEAHGDVFKRGFIDWEKELWADPQPARKGDSMSEGMQLGTGNQSWAQLSWSYVTARAWANSVYAIAPNQRLVYLMGGEMLYHLDKHRKDKSDYFVWTKLIQARIRGTTVLFQCTANTTRVTVLEGCIDVMNRKDKSIIRIEPGVVYEVKDTHEEGPEALNIGASSAATLGAGGNAAASQSDGPVTPQSSAATTKHEGGVSMQALPNITLNKTQPVTVFQTAQSVTSLYLANPQALLDHPLLTQLESPLSSLPLVGHALGQLVGKVDSLLSGGEALLGKTLLSEAKIISVPKSLSYQVGPLLGSAFTLPASSVSFFPPTSIIGGKAAAAGQLTSLTSGVGVSPAGMPNLNGLTRAGGTVTGGMVGAAAMPTSSLSSLGGGGLSAVSGVSGVSGFSGGATGFSGVSTMSAGYSMVPGSIGAARTSAAGILPGTTGALVSPITGGGLVAPVTTGATGAVSSVTGTAGGAVSGLTGTVNSVLHSAGGILGLPLGR